MPSLFKIKQLLPILLSLVFVAGLAAPSASMAVGSFNNADIANYAINNYPNGTPFGSCREFVNRIVLVVAHMNIAYGAPNQYFRAFEDNGAQRIYNVSDLRKGDIVQEGNAEPNVHTFIIIGQVSGSTFDVIDSNHDPKYHPNQVWRYNRTGVTLDNTHRAYRLGMVVAPAPPPPPLTPPICGRPEDLNGDCYVNGFDLSIFLNHWLQVGYNMPWDFNHDNIVNVFDESMLLGLMGT